MRRAWIAVLLVLVAAASSAAQNFGPAPPVVQPGAPAATICSTDWGWCPLQAVALPGGMCQCFVPPTTVLPGVARYWPYEGPVSPYLNPHQAPPSTLR